MVDDPENHEEPTEDDLKAPETAKSVKADIARALERETHDGKGDDEVPESNWNGFATEGVETSEDD